ncbi:MAG: recombinase family protein, partial [Ruthenibacterium sp.]
MRIAAYCRVSTDTADQLNSLETQKNFFLDYAQKNEFQLVHLYADEGISGTKLKNRKQFLQLMSDAKRGQFERIAVKDISRLARNTVDFLNSIRTLKALGIEVVFVNSNMTTSVDSEFTLTILGAIAQEESANTSKRIKFGKQSNAKKGRVPNIVFGYDKTIGDYFNLTINEDEAAVVRQIFHLYLDEGYGANRIAALLNTQGRLTKRGCTWSQNAVCRILKHELYAGQVINGKQEVADFLTGTRKTHEASDWFVSQRDDLRIIEPERLAQASAVMQKRGGEFRCNQVRQSNRHLFSTLIRCKECGRSFTRVSRSYKNTYTRWVCNRHLVTGPGKCDNGVMVDEPALIDALQNYFNAILSSQKDMTARMVRAFNTAYHASRDTAQQGTTLKKRLAQLESARQKYMDMYVNELITIQKELALIDQHLTQGDQLEKRMRETFAELRSITDISAMTNAQLKRIIEKIEVDRQGNIEIYLRLLCDLGLENTVVIRDNGTQGRH